MASEEAWIRLLDLVPDPRFDVAVGGIVGAVQGPEGLTDLQVDMLRAVLSRVLGSAIDPDTVARRSPAEVAAAVLDPTFRMLLVHTMVALEFVLHPEPRAIAQRVEDYADALDVDVPMVQAARDLADGQGALLYADIQRNALYTEEAIRDVLHGHFYELIRSKLAYQGIEPDEEIAAKWHTLEDCPEGSWGRGVADFYHAHHFPFPGELHGISELGAQHDFVHVLAEYEATPEGEIDVFAFIAASMPDPRGFTQFLMTLGLFQNGAIRHVAGKKVAIARTDTLSDPGAVQRWADALHRGAMCTVDVMAGVDHFALASRDLAELREEYSIPPKAQVATAQ